MLKYGNDTQLKLRLVAGASSVGKVTLNGFSRSGVIELRLSTTADGLRVENTVGIDDFPIWLSVLDEEGDFSQGECWASVQLLMNEDQGVQMCSGFVYGHKGIAFPGGDKADPLPNRGFITEVASTDPAAGVNTSITVPAGELWLFHIGQVDFITDATSATRTPRLIITQPSGLETRLTSGATQSASQNMRWHFAKFASGTDTNDNQDKSIAVPHQMYVLPGGTIESGSEGLQAGDNWGIMSLVVEKFPAQA